jgi:hypothetical protein
VPLQQPSQGQRKLGLIVHEGRLVRARWRSSEAKLAKRLTPFTENSPRRFPDHSPGFCFFDFKEGGGLWREPDGAIMFAALEDRRLEVRIAIWSNSMSP